MLLFVFLILTQISFSSQDLSGRCDMAKCSKETKILSESPEPPKIAIKETTIWLYEWPETEDIIYTDRWRFTGMCYQGSIIDPNTGCDRSEVEVPILKDKAKQYIEEGLCETGCECHYKSCVGSSSHCCWNNDLTNKKGPREYGATDYGFGPLAYHSCTSRWRCNTKKVKVYPIVSMNGISPKRHVLVKDNYVINFDEQFYSVGTKLENGVRYYSMLDLPPEPIIVGGKAKCYSSQRDDISCLINHKGKEIPFKVNPVSMKGVDRNLLLILDGPISTIVDGNITTMTPLENSIHANPIIQTRNLRERAASIETIDEIINGIQITQMQEISNVMDNRNEIIRTRNILYKVIKFISKKYPYMLSKVLDKNFKTRWLNEEVFQICPCVDTEDLFEESNCAGGMTYKEGEIVRTTDTKMECRSFMPSEVQNLSIITPSSSLDTEKIDYLPPKVASGDDPTWDWIVHERNRKLSYQENTLPHNNEGFFDSLSFLPNVKDIMLYFCTIICILYLVEKIIVVRNR